MNDFESSDETLQAFQHTIFSQDQPVLESQRPKASAVSDEAPVRELHSGADRSSAAYRRYLRERGISLRRRAERRAHRRSASPRFSTPDCTLTCPRITSRQCVSIRRRRRAADPLSQQLDQLAW
jgi:hypothetical protein